MQALRAGADASSTGWGEHKLDGHGPGGEREGWGRQELERGNGRLRGKERNEEEEKDERKKGKKNKPSVMIDGRTERVGLGLLINEQETKTTCRCCR